MCNGKTKAECCQYCIFGLPARNKDIVEKIKPATKLFLFDIDLKFLYGVYEDCSNGKLNLEPAAFGGRYPTQAKSSSYVHQTSLPTVKHNNFRRELTDQQVRNLSSLFHPFAQSSPESVLAPVPNISGPLQAVQHFALNDHLKPLARSNSTEEDPYLAVARNHAPPLVEHQPVDRNVPTAEHVWYETSATMYPHDLALEHPYLLDSHVLHLLDSHVLHHSPENQEPITMEGPYIRYRTMPEMAPRDHFTGTENEYFRYPWQKEMGSIPHQNNVAGYYKSYAITAARIYNPSYGTATCHTIRKASFI